MNRRLSVFLLISVLVHCGLCSDTTVSVIDSAESEDDNTDRNQSGEDKSVTLKTTEAVQAIVEQIVENQEELTTLSTTTIIDQPKSKEFLNEYLLNVNLLTPSLSDLTLKNEFNYLLLQTSQENQLFLIDKINGTIEQNFRDAHLIPVFRENQQLSDFLAIFDDHNQHLWLINATDRVKTDVSFKPKQIHIVSSDNEFFVVETSNQVGLFISSTSVLDWKTIDDSSSSIILGWSKDINNLVISQHSRHIKLLDFTNLKLTPILNDVSPSQLFSRYFLGKKSSDDASLILSHLNKWPYQPSRSLPKRLQSLGNFHCAVEDLEKQDLLLLFTDEVRLNENNETIPTTCRLVAYSKENNFRLENINCVLPISNESSTDSIKCSNQYAPIYQVQGLSRRVYLANIVPGPVTVVSLDGGLTWNKTHYECDKKIVNCPQNVSLIIDSLSSSAQTPGVVLGKATNGVEEFVAISIDAGHTWFLTPNNGSQVAISYPDAVIVMMQAAHVSSSTDSYRFSTDYGRTWQSGTFSNRSSLTVQSFVADKDNRFYLIASNEQEQLNLIELDFNFIIANSCARHQLKEWSLPNSCQHGLKLFYKRRTTGANCVDRIATSRTEPCTCTLADFECATDYKRSKDGTCSPRSHYTRLQDCACQDNSTLTSKRRGYVKNSECLDGIEDYLSDASVMRRESNQPILFLYGNDKKTNNGIIEIENNDFYAHGDEQDDEDEDEDEFTRNLIWKTDSSQQVKAIVFDESSKQVFVAIENEQLSFVYRLGKNLQKQDRSEKLLAFDVNDEFYKTADGEIQSISIDWLSRNLYVLVRDKKTMVSSIILIDLRTRKRRVIVKNQQTEPAIILVDPLKTNLYWITKNSPSLLNIANLQGQMKKTISLSSITSTIDYVAYDSITHELVLVSNTSIYTLNTLNMHQPVPKLIYEHSSTIDRPLLIYPTLFFVSKVQHESETTLNLNTIDVVAKSFAKNVAHLKDLNNLNVLADMSPTMPKSIEPTPCESNPCSDICINLEDGRFRCVCADDASYQACSCPTAEKFFAGSCQAKNEQCASGRVLCQNRIHCAESALVCERDHTKYTESFKTSSRCTIEKENDGFNCYYTGTGINHGNNTCIPYEWFCDGVKDCPMGNDEDHCYKLTTTTTPSLAVASRCLTDKRFNYAMCAGRCTKISSVCQNSEHADLCPEQFHLHCQRSEHEDKYECKCHDHRYQCLAMIKECDDAKECRQVCQDSNRYAMSELDRLSTGWKSSTTTYVTIGFLIGIIILVILLVICCRRDKRRKGSAKHTLVPNSDPNNDLPISQQNNSKKLNKATNTASETS